MTISDSATEFAGLPVRDYEPGQALEAPQSHAWRIGFGSEYYDSKEKLADRVKAFAAQPGADRVAAIVIGTWEEMAEGGASQTIADALGACAGSLKGLKAVFFGDVTFEECEISWIVQGSMAPILAAYPALQEFRVRGGNGLTLGPLKHAALRTLIVESGGLGSGIVREVASADLPELTHLELWLGDDNYGADWSLEDLSPILQGERFPKLQNLALRDSDRADEVAAAVAAAPILQRIRRLDLSMGTLGDEGGDALLRNPHIGKLQELDLHYHFLSAAMMKRFEALGIRVNLDDRQEAEEGDRFVAVGE